MIIRHSPPRKTPDLYSDDLYDGICVGLGVQDEQQKIYFKETIERAALSLIKAWKENPQKFTDSEEKYELKRLAKSLKKSRTVNSLSSRLLSTSVKILIFKRCVFCLCLNK